MRKIGPIIGLAALIMLALAFPVAMASGHEHHQGEGNVFGDAYLTDPEVEGWYLDGPTTFTYYNYNHPPVVNIGYTAQPFRPIEMKMGDELYVTWTPTGTGHTAGIRYAYTPGIVYFGTYPMYQLNNFLYNGAYISLYYDGYGYPVGVDETSKIVYYFWPQQYSYDPAYNALIDWLNDDTYTYTYVSSPPFTITHSPAIVSTSISYSSSSGVVLH